MLDTDTDVFFDLEETTKALRTLKRKKIRSAVDEQRMWEIKRDLHIIDLKKRELAERKRRGELTDPEEADTLRTAFVDFVKLFGVTVAVVYEEGERNRDGELLCWKVRARCVRSDPVIDSEKWAKMVKKFNAEPRDEEEFCFVDWQSVEISTEESFEATWRIDPPILG